MFKHLNIFAALLLSLVIGQAVIVPALPASAQAPLSNTIDCNPALAPNYANLSEKDKDIIRKSYTDRGEPFNDKPCDIPAFIRFLKNLINWGVGITIPLATGFIVYGAFVIMTAGGNAGKVDDGKKVILAAVIGVAIALGSYLIVNAILNLIPINTSVVK